MEPAPPPASTAALAQGQGTQKKRKGAPPSSAASLKKIKTIIDCQKAITFLSGLGLYKSFLDSGKILAWNLEPTDPDYLNISTLVTNGQPSVFFEGKCELLQVVRVMACADGLQDYETLSSFNDDPRTKGQLRKMLWHGTSRKNVGKILQNGLKLPKKLSFKLYGHGIYFSDLFEMSLCYCRTWRSSGPEWEVDKDGTIICYLFLSDVLLGDVQKTYWLKPSAPKIAVSKPGAWFWEKKEIKVVDSMQGCGKWIMDPLGDRVIDGCVWPLGQKIENEERPWITPLLSNEYVVYETRRVIPKFLVKVKVDFMRWKL